MAACPTFDPLGPYVTGAVAFVDCQIRALGEEGYRALGWGSPIGTAITGLITIYIAFIGYRMLFGDVPNVRQGVLAAVRIGAVLALATQWPAYQILVYNVVMDEPASLASRILDTSDLGGGSSADLLGRLQATYDAIDRLAHPEAPPSPAPTTSAVAGAGPQASGTPSAAPTPPLTAGLLRIEDRSMASAERFLLAGALGGLLSMRVVAGLLLALGPLFAGFLLFETTLGLFIGWLRVLAATIVGNVGVFAVLALELAILTPQANAAAQAVADGTTVPTLSGELLATTIIFGVLMLAALTGVFFVALGLRAPASLNIRLQTEAAGERRAGTAVSHVTVPAFAGTANDNALRSRAQLIADRVLDLDRREERGAGRTSERAVVAERLDRRSDGVEPLGQSARRTTQRRSASAVRRDSKA